MKSGRKLELIMMTCRVVAKASRNFKATVAKKLRKVTQDTKIAMMLQDLPRVPHLSLILEGCNCQTALESYTR